MLTCTDFKGRCCPSCHATIGALMTVLNSDETIYASVCCMKVNQAEMRKDKVTEPIKENHGS